MRTVAKQYLNKYHSKNDVEKHSNTVLASYPGLNVVFEKFFFSDGASCDLICLKGTIPINFRGASYNIPISMHLPQHYPQKPPIIYVTPTSTMAVKISKTIDANGMVKLPYVINWNSRTHSLMGVVNAMTNDFSREPPVYSKSQSQQSRPPQPHPQHHPPYNPFPNQPGPRGPTGGANMPPYPIGMDPSVMRPPFDLPPYDPNPPAYHPPAAGIGMSPYLPHQYPSNQPTAQTTYGSSATNGSSVDPIKESLLTAITENLSRRIANAQEMAQKDLDKLRSVQGQLKSNRDQLERTVSELEQQIAFASSHIDLLNNKKSEIESAIEEVQIKAEINDIDDCITPSCPLYKQLLNLYAEECAIEDTIYYLDKALMDSVVDLETYLKNVRSLSRKQFMLRAQMQKARQTAGLKNITPH